MYCDDEDSNKATLSEMLMIEKAANTETDY
jgi:hypothetical protein